MPSTATQLESETATAAPRAVEAEALGKSIDDRRILADLSFIVAQGSYTALLGANGAGKSTLLKLLATLTTPTRGSLKLFGEDAGRSAMRIRSRLGMIGHEIMLYRDLSPWENLILFGRLYGVPDPQSRAKELIATVGLAQRTHDPIKTFSRGMAQRMSIARALMHDPHLLLADEPFAGLDAPSTRLVERMLDDLHRQGKTILLVNHDIGQSLRLAEHVLVLRSGNLIIDQPASQLDEESVLAEVSAT